MKGAAGLICLVLVLGGCGDDGTPPVDSATDLVVDRSTTDGGADLSVTDGAPPDAPATDGPVVTPDGPVVTPDGPVVTPDGPVVTPDGPVVTPDGPVVTPDGPVVTPDGAVVTPDGPVVTPDGAVVTPDGPVVTPDAGAAVCGNGAREAAEQCDDGNTTNLDGCDSLCRFEQDHRANYLLMQYGTDAYCAKNAFGGAFVASAVRNILQSTLDDGIADGSITILFKFLGLDDLSGASDPALQLGVMAGSPVSTPAYDGTSDLDWWYDVDTSTIDAQRNPVAQVNGQITNSVLSAGPGNLSVTLVLVGTPAQLTMSSAKITGTIGASSAPLTSTGNTPGHLAAEHLSPSLQSFATVGTKTSTGAAKLCGNVSGTALAAVPMPSSLAGGFLGCQGYSASNNNSMLDLLVAGCSVFLVGQAIAPTQPDTDDPAVAPVGAGPPYTLTASSSTKKVTQCRDKNNTVVNLQACLADAAYSVFLKFASGRVIIK